ncbi:hypothetical protein DH2020_038443 [Rehmannia glutinosa]|uniref:Atos-like conserved domain-containing protein n=1 Tax=Rehmannia glutinosa TaxID=99300 RepID=A0ABR0UYX5_REHGL
MGLPQVSSGNLSEEVSTSARFSSVGSFGVSDRHTRQSSNRMPSDFSCSSSQESDLTSLHKLRIDSMDKNRKNIQTPASRIIGFETNALTNRSNQEKQSDSVSFGNGVACNSNENSSSLVRKRLLSPLNGMLLPDEFRGEHLEIGNTFHHGNSHLRGGSYSISVNENKKAHIGNLDFGSPIWSASNFSRNNSPPEEVCETNSRIITDGPLLENHEHRFQNLVPPYYGVTSCSGTCESPPFSLSPLGPRFCGRTRSFRGSREFRREFDESCITFKDVEQSLEGTISDFFLPGHNSTLTTQNVKLGKTFSGLSVRRSLVGSFEESLLSGRLASGVVSQKIDGFLAVLNITGGKFAPHPQKLPFAVTSVDGDNYLLYYSSIDLSRHLSSNKCEGPKLKRSLSVNGSSVKKLV